MLSEEQLALLDRQGWLVVPQLVPLAATARARALIDRAIGAPPNPPLVQAAADAPCPSAADWPTDSPVVLSSNYRHMLQPPCPDPDDAVLAELLAPLIENIYPALYGLQPHEAGELRLLNQSFVRTDASPEYRPDGAPGELSWPPQGWHMVGRDPHPNSPSIWLLLGPASCCRHSSTHSRGPAPGPRVPAAALRRPPAPELLAHDAGAQRRPGRRRQPLRRPRLPRQDEGGYRGAERGGAGGVGVTGGGHADQAGAVRPAEARRHRVGYDGAP